MCIALNIQQSSCNRRSAMARRNDERLPTLASELWQHVANRNAIYVYDKLLDLDVNRIFLPRKFIVVIVTNQRSCIFQTISRA